MGCTTLMNKRIPLTEQDIDITKKNAPRKKIKKIKKIKKKKRKSHKNQIKNTSIKNTSIKISKVNDYDNIISIDYSDYSRSCSFRVNPVIDENSNTIYNYLKYINNRPNQINDKTNNVEK